MWLVTTSTQLASDIIRGKPARCRHKDWSRESKLFMKSFRFCVCCGNKTQVVHHVFPVHAYPDLEMEKSHWRAVCHRCHLLVGHLNLFASWNVKFDEDASLIRSRILTRPMVRRAVA